MRFDLKESIEALRAGRKSQTRRRDPSGFWLEKEPGSRITIEHGGKRLGMAEIKQTWRQCLGDVGDAAAKAEGYESRAAFVAAWTAMYPDADVINDWVTAIEFGPVRWTEPMPQSARGTP